jgi:hypothetical protein
MSHWHVVVEGPDELHKRRSFVVRELARAEMEREYERYGQTSASPRYVTIVNCDDDCLGYPSPPSKVSA